MSEEFIWPEKYRPQTIEETILPSRLKDVFKAMVEKGDIPNMLFTGQPGRGKTTVARALCEELGFDYLFVNGSLEGGIDTLRNKVQQFASSVSLTGDPKVVILDEADHLNPLSFQPALRGFIEAYSSNCRFILTCNFKNKILGPLHSRFSAYDFDVSKKELQVLAAEFMKNAEKILKVEGIEYDKKALANMIIRRAPDWRRILNELQKTGISGDVTEANVVISETQFKDLFAHLKAKDFKKMRQWVANNIDVETTAIIRGVYDEMFTYVEPRSIPALVVLLGEYQYKAAFVADQEVNLVALMTEIMSEVNIK